jgi:hypothetical protein
MKYTHKIDDVVMVVDCDESLQQYAKQLLQDLSDMHFKGPPLKSGSKIHYGWVTLTLNKKDNLLEICEPDFINHDLQRHIANLDLTLKVLAEQSILHHQLNIIPQSISYLDSILVTKDCLKEIDIYIERQKPVRDSDSGWYIGSVDNNASKEKEFYSIKVYELLQLRPEIMAALTLPEKYIAVFSDKKLIEILDQNDNQIWPV